jgi:hypothetical protein
MANEQLSLYLMISAAIKEHHHLIELKISA